MTRTWINDFLIYLNLVPCRASFVPNWYLTKAVSSGLNYVNLPAVSTQSREEAAAPGPEVSMTAHECVRGRFCSSAKTLGLLRKWN